MKKATDGVPIAVVEQETGLSKDVLRKWEARYNYPLPDRNDRGDRLYSRRQITRLRMIKRLLDRGYRPSKLLGMSEAELAELTAPSSVRSDNRNMSAVSELLELLKNNQPLKLRLALKRLLQAQGLKLFVQDTIAPLAIAVGEAWSNGEIRVFEEHLFSDIAASSLRQALESIDVPDGRPRILMTTLPGEAHSLGLLMAACLFTLNGAHCIYLGTETPSQEISLATQAHNPDVVALSFSSAFPTRQIQPALHDLRLQIPRGIEIMAGGVGIKRTKPLAGVHYMNDFASIDEYFAKRDQDLTSALT